MSDIQITCIDCGKVFEFTESEQAFFAEHQFPQPVRCKDCKKLKKDRFAPKPIEKSFFKSICAKCYAPITLPFTPKGDKPAFCDKCKKTVEA